MPEVTAAPEEGTRRLDGVGRASTGRVPLSVLITSFNEERNIVACLRSVSWAAEILLVDSFSTDRTVVLASPLADRILLHRYESPARQKNWAMDQTRYGWILILDADERASPELAREVDDLMACGPLKPAYWIHRRNTFLGREIRHGGWERDRVIRLFDRRQAHYPDVRVHEEMQVVGAVGKLAGRLDHHSYRSLDGYAGKLDRYTSWWAQDRADKGRRASAGTALLHTVGRFIHMYLLRRGFLDGSHGLILALMASFSVFLKYARLWEMDKRHPDPE